MTMVMTMVKYTRDRQTPQPSHALSHQPVWLCSKTWKTESPWRSLWSFSLGLLQSKPVQPCTNATARERVSPITS